MKDSVFELSLDVHGRGLQQSLAVKRGDSARALCIRLTQSGRSYEVSSDCTAVFTAKKPDETLLYNRCTLEKGTICYRFTGQESNVPGLVLCELRLYDPEGRLLTSPSFCLLVEDTVYDDEAVMDSSPEFTALTALVSRTQTLLEELAMAKRYPLVARSALGVQYTAEAEDLTPLEGTEILLLPQSANASAPTLSINGGEAYPLCLRPGWNVTGDDRNPQLTLPIPEGMLLRGAEYLFRLEAACWILQSFVELPKEAEDGALRTDGAMEAPELGAELVSQKGWSYEDWTGDPVSGFTHLAGNTTPLEFVLPEDTGTNLYYVSFTLSVAATPTNLLVSLGKSNPVQLYGQAAEPFELGIRSVRNGALQFIPESSFTGTISNISIRRFVGSTQGVLQITDSEGQTAFELRATKEKQNNLFLGTNAGRENYSGYGNASLGKDTLMGNTSGFWNIALGYQALRNNTVGSRNIAIGYSALLNNGVGNRNIAIGSFAMNHNVTGCWNIAIGADCLDKNTAGHYNTALGFQAMYNNTSGGKNVAIGYAALAKNTTGSNNVAVGSTSLGVLTTGSNNVGVGYGSFAYETTGHSNVGLGMNAGYKAKGGNNNVAIGLNAMKGSASAAYTQNVCIGSSAGEGFSAATATGNVLLGHAAGKTITTGGNNIVIGANVNPTEATGSYQLNIGNLIRGQMNGVKYVQIHGGLQIDNLPTEDPGMPGRLWNDGGTVKISTGG